MSVCLYLTTSHEGSMFISITNYHVGNGKQLNAEVGSVPFLSAYMHSGLRTLDMKVKK